jgi:DNA/RNA endonuclease G (NUC1)
MIISTFLKILNLSKIIEKDTADQDFGLRKENCDQYFYGDLPFPNLTSSRAVIRLCQKNAAGEVKFSTLYSIEDRIPIYSAYIINRSAKRPHYPRPSSQGLWPRLARGLCFDGDYDLDQSYSSRIDHVRHNYWNICDSHQVTNDAYQGNWAKIHIDRGHLNPNEVNNHDQAAQETTFTLTNVAPQYSRFNELAWREYECIVREFIEQYNPERDHYAFTGTLGTHGWMNVDESGRQKVKIPKYYWKTVCFPNGSDSWAFAIIDLNLNSRDTALSTNIMTVDDLSRNYLNSAPIYDNLCQTAPLGPFEKIIADWDSWKKLLSCEYADEQKL